MLILRPQNKFENESQYVLDAHIIANYSHSRIRQTAETCIPGVLKSMHSPQPARAFTLIELLIVVAIIAILAAIAVPNFLEAQTRAKVSRVKSDQRSLATAIESYRVDNNEYPEGTDELDEQPGNIA